MIKGTVREGMVLAEMMHVAFYGADGAEDIVAGEAVVCEKNPLI